MIDGATSTFLEAVTVDLQQQLGLAGSVEDVSLEQLWGGHLAIVAAIRVAGEDLVIRGTGDNILSAYAALRQSVSQALLESAFAQIVDASTLVR